MRAPFQRRGPSGSWRVRVLDLPDLLSEWTRVISRCSVLCASHRTPRSAALPPPSGPRPRHFLIRGRGRCHIKKQDKIITSRNLRGSLYVLDERPSSNEVACVATLRLWLERLVHVSSNGISYMVLDRVVKGVKISSTPDPSHICAGCIYGKGRQTPIPKKSSSTSSALLEHVQSDVLGLINVPSTGGSRYFITFIDAMFTMGNMSTIFRIHKPVINFNVSMLSSPTMLLLSTNNGGEHFSNEFRAYTAQSGIHHQLILAYTPQQNGVAARMDRTLMNSARSLLHSREIDNLFLAEAVSTAVYAGNRASSRGLPLNTTPHHFWMGFALNLEHMHVLESRCWHVLRGRKVKKLYRRAHEAVMIR